MAAARMKSADVIIPVFADVALTQACIDAVLTHSGEALGRLFLIDDCGPDVTMRPMLRGFRERDSRVHVIENPRNLGFVATANRGLALARGHAVILNSDTRVTAGWLAALLAVLESSERIAAVCPLSNNATLCSVPTFGTSSPETAVASLPGALQSLPEWTELPTGNGFCMLMRDTALRSLGLLDPAYGRGYNEENDWCQRARAQGMLVARANRSFVFHRGEVSFGAARPLLDLINATRLVARYPRYLEENRAFAESPLAHVAATGARSRLKDERWALHPGLQGLPGVQSLLGELMTARGAHAVEGAEASAPGAEDLRVAPLHHADAASARAAIRGTGRLVTLMDAWRPTPVGPLKSLRWAQLQASDAVFVPSDRAAAWLAEEGITANVRVLPWPSAAADSPPARTPAPEPERRRVLLVEPTPTIRALVELALARLDVPLTLTILKAGEGSHQLAAALREALALVDFGGTSAAHLVAARAHGVHVLSGLTSVAGPAARAPKEVPPGLEGVARALALRLDAEGHAQPANDPPAPRWHAALDEVLLAPDGPRIESRAALQVLIG